MDTNPSAPESGGGTPPNLATLPRPVLISGIGAIVLFVSVFLDWYSASASISGLGNIGVPTVSHSWSGWSATDVAKLVALLAVIAIAAWAIELFAKDFTLPAPAWQIAGGAGVISVLLVLYRIASKPGLGLPDVNVNLPNGGHIGISVSTSFGIYLALIAAVATVAGAVMAMREA